ncbi:Methionine adenosyltransferase 2 subunit beta [Smittium mucronatum]|uniref:Methionine adenosyltransferase 2 subunit beta n=1 Tax=Smittium mucronatum TaxID=133383 RepID=A0A1R0GVF2_9FUNG|nr:Methionine adenosyltransferase 2 subunit beta [Smittium mucronatum]
MENKKLSVVVTGASGLLGRQVYEEFKIKGHKGTAHNRVSGDLVKLNLVSRIEVERFFNFQVDVLIHCAAERRPDEVHKNPENSKLLNEKVPGVLAKICKEKGIFFIYISTDYVFDGKSPPYEANSVPNPINEYGVSKLNGEKAVVDSGIIDYVILRVPILYGRIEFLSESSVDSLLKAVLLARDRFKEPSTFKKFGADVFQVRYPTNVADVSRVVCEISEKRIQNQKEFRGIAQFSAKGKMTKYDMCKLFAQCLNVNGDDLFFPESPAPGQNAVDRPENVQLSTKVLEGWGIEISYIDFNSWWSKNIQNNTYILKSSDN